MFRKTTSFSLEIPRKTNLQNEVLLSVRMFDVKRMKSKTGRERYYYQTKKSVSCCERQDTLAKVSFGAAYTARTQITL